MYLELVSYIISLFYLSVYNKNTALLVHFNIY